MPRITFQALGVANSFRERARLSKWITHVAKDHGVMVGDLAFVLLTDEGLLQYNKRYLNHDDYTDVITFDGQTGNGVSGDILISLDRVAANAKGLGVPLQVELRRVMVHGLLHLLGYKDKSAKAKTAMRKAEDDLLQLYLKQ
ncbi:MAG TPA: rRNA maturation RNase YbeY [Flavobacteriales bacterium]|nr:rRNA maturation RNase YbeY [Flavobacteriales bacterium]